MWSFLSELTRDPRATYTVIVMDEERMEQPRQHLVQPSRLFLAWGGSAALLAVLLVSLVVFTPLRELIPGYGTAEMRRAARLNAVRLAALQDSLLAQQQYMEQVRRLVLGDVPPAAEEDSPLPEQSTVATGELAELGGEGLSANWEDHVQPAVPLDRMSAAGETGIRVVSAGDRYLSTLQFPVLPPVSGFFTRGFDARIGHYALDIAAEEGTIVRSIGDGHVVLADWTNDGGYTIAIQHADGYVSIYKHNQRLLKRIGDRVRDREPIARSGNTGEVTTGPHLHFELWREGLAQDPRAYVIGEQ